MAAIESVAVATKARDHARSSMDRMTSHLANGNAKGVAREVQFLNSLDKQATRLAAKASGAASTQAHKGLGARALARMQDPTTRGIARSGLLAEFSDDIMKSARDTTTRFGVGGKWVWTANHSACAACLVEHGKTHSGDMTPMHPSCLCIPDDSGLARELTDGELGDLMVARGGRDAQIGEWLRSGDLTRQTLFKSIGNGQRVQRNYAPGFAQDTVKHKWTKSEVQFLDNLGKYATKKDVVYYYRNAHPNFAGSDQSIWAKHQRTHDLLGKKKIAKSAPTNLQAASKSLFQDLKTQHLANQKAGLKIPQGSAYPKKSVNPFDAPPGVQVKIVNVNVAEDVTRIRAWDNGTSVYQIPSHAANTADDAYKLIQQRYGVDNVLSVATKQGPDGSWRLVIRHLDAEKAIKAGNDNKFFAGVQSPKKYQAPASAPKPTPAPPTPTPPAPVADIPLPKGKIFKDAVYKVDPADGAPRITLADGTTIVNRGATGVAKQFDDDLLKLIRELDANSVIKNKGVKEIEFRTGPIPGKPTASGLYHDGKIIIRLDAPGADVAHTIRHELGHAFTNTKQGIAIRSEFDDLMKAAFNNWDELDDATKAAYNYARSKYVSGDAATALEEAWADSFAAYMSGQKVLLGKIDARVIELFDDATRRLAFVPVKKPTRKNSFTDWFFKDNDIRTASPNFTRLESEASKWINALTADERRLVRDYTGSWAGSINSKLANGTQTVDNHAVKALNTALKKFNNPEPVYSWRKVPDTISAKMRTELDRALANGGTITHIPFASTTTKPGSYGSMGRGTQLVLEMKSKSGAYIRNVSSFGHENEFLIPAGTKYKVVGQKTVKFKNFDSGPVSQTIYQLEEIT